MHLTVRDETEINCDTLGSASHWRLGLFCGRCGVAGEDRFSGAQRLLAALLLDGTGGAWFCPTHTFLFLHGRFLFGSLRSFRFLFRLLWDRDAFRSSTSRFAPSPSPWIFRFLFWLSSFCSLRSFIFLHPPFPDWVASCFTVFSLRSRSWCSRIMSSRGRSMSIGYSMRTLGKVRRVMLSGCFA